MREAGSAAGAGSALAVVEVTAKDLPLHCPNPAMPLWSSHPRVFLDVGADGEAMCPYCGTRYRLSGGEPKRPV
jgi:uncharacterized Zn-finger protein